MAFRVIFLIVPFLFSCSQSSSTSKDSPGSQKKTSTKTTKKTGTKDKEKHPSSPKPDENNKSNQLAPTHDEGGSKQGDQLPENVPPHSINPEETDNNSKDQEDEKLPIIHTETPQGDIEIPIFKRKFIYTKHQVEHGGDCGYQTGTAPWLTLTLQELEKGFKKIEVEVLNNPNLKIIEHPRFRAKWKNYQTFSQDESFSVLFNEAKRIVFSLKNSGVVVVPTTEREKLSKFIRQLAIVTAILQGGGFLKFTPKGLNSQHSMNKDLKFAQFRSSKLFTDVRDLKVRQRDFKNAEEYYQKKKQFDRKMDKLIDSLYDAKGSDSLHSLLKHKLKTIDQEFKFLPEVSMKEVKYRLQKLYDGVKNYKSYNPQKKENFDADELIKIAVSSHLKDQTESFFQQNLPRGKKWWANTYAMKALFSYFKPSGVQVTNVPVPNSTNSFYFGKALPPRFILSNTYGAFWDYLVFKEEIS